jgi:membrane-associated phospholipid phosphatase
MTAIDAAMTLGRVRGWLSRRHSLLSEALLVLGLYGAYELARGVVAGDTGEADQHAHRLVALEQSLHVFHEAGVQQAAQALPGLIGTLGTAYLTLHLTVTVAVLLWLHQRRPESFAFVRTTLLLASGLALVGFLAYPTAPPRLAGIGIADTVSNSHVSLNHGLVSSLYNPYAAFPSMHVGYALVVSASLLRYGGAPLVRALGIVYAPAVLLVVVATGNHFFVDAAAGAAAAGLAAAGTTVLTRPATPTRIAALPTAREHVPTVERRAA